MWGTEGLLNTAVLSQGRDHLALPRQRVVEARYDLAIQPIHHTSLTNSGKPFSDSVFYILFYFPSSPL